MNKTQERRVRRLEQTRLAPIDNRPTEIWLIGIEKTKHNLFTEKSEFLLWKADQV